MLPQEIIRKKRDGIALPTADIQEFITGVTAKTVSESQVAAFCMAVLLKGMSMEERVALTAAMAHSGTVMDWSHENLHGPVLDKHSTGGVGDKVSLMLAPIIAACGGFVPMLSGRGLGHTGGTLDKMDSIAGYVSQPDITLLKKTVREVGCAIIGATPDLAPADRIIYAVRDVTGTVESIDLITASILAKKLAGGLQGLVMDVKFGTGAFMRQYADAQALTHSIVSVANGARLPTVGLLTDMNEVLGTTAGNAVEVLEAVDYLTGKFREPRLHEVTVALCAELLVLGKITATTNEARQKIETVLNNGKATEHFAKMVAMLGGAADFVEQPEKYLKTAPLIQDFYLPQKGFITAMDVYSIGIGIVELGGGRAKTSDIIDHSVGLTNISGIGDATDKPFCTIHAKNVSDFARIVARISAAVTVGDQPTIRGNIIQERVTA